MISTAPVLTDLPKITLSRGRHDVLLETAEHPLRLMVNERSAPFQSAPMLPLAAILALIPQPALIVDSDAHVQAINRSVSRWLENQKTLDVSTGRVSWRNARHQIAFSAVLKTLTDDSADALTHQHARLPLSGHERTLPLIIDCHRLRTTEPMHDGAVRDHALLVLHDLKGARRSICVC